MKALENETAQLQRKIQKLQGEHDSYVRAKTSIDRSKTKVIEDKLLAESRTRYINANGSKNWMLLNKDIAILENKLNVSETGLPDRKSMMTLLSNSTKEYSLTGRPNVSKFPTSTHPSTCSAGSSTSTFQLSTCEKDVEIGDFALAVSLQNEECNDYKDQQDHYEAASSLMEMFNTNGTSKRK